MELSLPKHLQPILGACSKNNNLKNYRPPFPAWTARFPPQNKDIVIAYFGVQSTYSTDINDLSFVTNRFAPLSKPVYWEFAHHEDMRGYHNLVVITYWPSLSQFNDWMAVSGFSAWWEDCAREKEALGRFIEVVAPTMDRFETISSNRDNTEGAVFLGVGMSDEIQEHGYWGSMRDRLSIARVDSLIGEVSGKKNNVSQNSSRRIRINAPHNLCLIRSVQDWSHTEEDERRRYLDDIEPILRKGMQFLQEHGSQVGCLNCRYMEVLSAEEEGKKQKTFGMAYFKDLNHLERWAKEHPSHIEIFGSFISYVKEFGFDVKLRLYHEVSVTDSSGHFFEYINCHLGTGLLSAQS